MCRGKGDARKEKWLFILRCWNLRATPPSRFFIERRGSDITHLLLLVVPHSVGWVAATVTDEDTPVADRIELPTPCSIWDLAEGLAADDTER